MPVPTFQALMLPALKALSNRKETRLSEVRERVAESERLSPDDLREMLPSGSQPVFANRVTWALYYMYRAGVLERVRHGVWRLNEEGAKLLANPPSEIDMKFLERYPSYVEWKKASKSEPSTDDGSVDAAGDSAETPEEALEKAARRMRETIEADVLARVRDAPPAFFERVVVDLLIAMGYGGGDAEMGQVTGRSGDGGIDGTIKEDALGLDEVYVQAKKYAAGNTVGEGDLRNFAGALIATGTTKGVFATTTSFMKQAKTYVARINTKRIVLIDGEELAHLMVQHDVGVRPRDQGRQQDFYKIKRIDEDYLDQ